MLNEYSGHDNGEIHVLTMADFPDIAETLAEAYGSARYPIGGTWTKDLLKQELKVSQGIGLKVEGQGLTSFILYRYFDEHREITILATTPSFQRKGDMRFLLSYLLERKSPGEKIWLEVHEQNEPARQLYLILGFQEVGRRPKYYKDGRDAILYTIGHP